MADKTKTPKLPGPKRLRGKCPLEIEGNMYCIGEQCRFIKKNCIYQRLKRTYGNHYLVYSPKGILLLPYYTGAVFVTPGDGE